MSLNKSKTPIIKIGRHPVFRYSGQNCWHIIDAFSWGINIFRLHLNFEMVLLKKLRCSFNGKINNEGHKQNAF